MELKSLTATQKEDVCEQAGLKTTQNISKEMGHAVHTISNDLFHIT